jgi:hypothetical protein
MLTVSDNTVVFFIDLQEVFVPASRTNSSTDLRRSVGALADLSSRLSLPAVISAFRNGPEQLGVLSEITTALPDAPIIARQTASALASGDARAELERTGRRNLILCGIASEVAILHTALEARSLGFATQIVLDATGGLTPRGEAAALRRLEAAGCVMTSVPSLLSELVGDFGSAEGAKVVDILVGLAS